MCQPTPHPHSIFCILPPHVLRNIARNGTPRQRAAAMQTLTTDQTFRAIRAAQGMSLVAARRAPTLIAEGQKRRTIFDARHEQTLPGRLVRGEGDGPTGDAAVDEAYDGLGATHDFYWEVHERDSIDDDGLPLNATVHFGDDYNNAFWDGTRMVFGDGDGQLFNRFTISLDVIGHELAHGVTEDEAQLVYLFQPGALNESLSDVFGSLVKQRLLGQTAEEADWLIGAGLFTDQVQGVALRSMAEPGSAFDDPILGRDPQPAHMDDFVRTYDDNGGVHINSGIPNHAFYHAAMRLGGYAWERAWLIWYETLRDSRLRRDAGFRRFARLTVLNAGRLFGLRSPEERAVREGWDRVGLRVS